MSKKDKQVQAAKPVHFNLLRSPVVTEKSTAASEQGKVVFYVAQESSKIDIKSAVEAIFSVNVTKVNTLVVKGKTKLFRGRKGQRSDVKKAVVTLKEGQSIDFAAGVK